MLLTSSSPKSTRQNFNGCTFYSSPREVDDLGPVSDSLGDWRDITEYRDYAYDPMGPARFSGSGTANPKSTQFRQVMVNDSNGDVVALETELLLAMIDMGGILALRRA